MMDGGLTWRRLIGRMRVVDGPRQKRPHACFFLLLVIDWDCFSLGCEYQILVVPWFSAIVHGGPAIFDSI